MSTTFPELHFEWEPDLKRIESNLLEAEEYFHNPTAPIAAARLIAIRDTEEHFYKEEDPEGNAWDYWADSYASTAEAENVGILRKSENLFYAATDPSAYQVVPNAMFIDTSKFPPYWAVQQDGGGRNVPPRPYLGLSNEAQTEIEGTFETWVEEGGLVFTRGGKQVRSHVFQAPTGHFISAK